MVALSDAYHQYNPLFIRDIKALLVLNGFDCIVTSCYSSDAVDGNNSSAVHLLPVSKCEIMGIVRYRQVKSNGSISLILDDGSGVIDAIFWSDIHTVNENTPFAVGETVRVRGNINVLSLNEKKIVYLDGQKYEGREGVREIYISSFQRVIEPNEEVAHWVLCLLFRKRLQDTTDCRNEMNFDNHMLYAPVLNGLETYNILPASMKEQVSLDECYVNTSQGQEWFFVKYYGRGCRCNLSYKDKLLYCHCLATKDMNDPDFVFRDALLETLLHFEQALKVESLSSTSNNNGANVSEMTDESKVVPSCLQFEFSGILRCHSLQLLAKEVLQASDNLYYNIHKLFSSAIRCLRKDGVLYLQDERKDIYILLSADSVLIPTVKNQIISEEQLDFELSMNSLRSNTHPVSKLPNYMESLPYKKLQLVRRLAGIERKKTNTFSAV